MLKILILARIAAAFDGGTYKTQPLGGSESALLYLSRELAKLGHQVVIFNNCGKNAGIYDKVEYRCFTTLLDLVKYSKKEDFDVFIAYRDLPALLFPIKAKKRIAWLADDFSPVWNRQPPLNWLGIGFLKFTSFLIQHLTDKVFVVSHWLGKICSDYLGLPGKMIYVTRNGVELSYFNERGLVREPARLVFSSVPNRGLDILLEVFPRIKKEVPDVKLYVYGGFELGVISQKQKAAMGKIFEAAKQPGVVLAGTRTHTDLARELLQGTLWVYPSHEVKETGFYAETSCIAALEAQAAGCPVIAGKRGALVESVQDGKTGILVEGDPYSKEFKEKFTQEIIKLLKDKNRWEELSRNCREFIRTKYSWENIAQEWSEEFKVLLRP